MRLMLDSTFLIDHLRGDREAVERFASFFEAGDEPFVNLLGVCEVESGLRPTEERAFLALLHAVEFVQAGPEAARDAGRWRREALQRGAHLSVPDALIAAEAHHAGAVVLTRNVRDFALTPVRVESY